MITVQATNRLLRFLPTRRVAEAIWFVFAWALIGFDIDVHEFCFMSNHFHVVLTPRRANLPQFTQKLHMLLSKSLNALRGTTGSNIEAGYNIVVECDPEAIVRACAYTLANPVTADLVTRAEQWKGPNSYRLEYGREVTVSRPRHGLWRHTRPHEAASCKSKPGKKDTQRPTPRRRTRTPESVTFTLFRPPVARPDLSDAQLRREIRRRVETRQREAERKRSNEGRKVMGMKAVLMQDWRELPRSRQELFELEPLFNATTPEVKRAALQARRAFIAAYRAALAAWIAGDRDVVFPAGTWLMRRRFDVCCAPAPPGS